MCSAPTSLLPVLLAVAPLGAAPVHASLEIAPNTIRLGDPLFARVTIWNIGTEPVEIPLQFLRESTLFFEVGNSSSDYLYLARGESGAGGVEPGVLAPKTRCVVAYEIIEMPPADHFSRDFWAEIVALGGAGIAARLTHPLVDPAQPARAGFRVMERPGAEMERLGRLCAELTRRRREHRDLPDGFDYPRPQPAVFGLASLRSDEDLVPALLSMEGDLSPGPLRDVVHVTNLTRAIYDAQDAASRKEMVAELLAWLNTLPEIERHCLAIRLLAWCGSSAPSEPAFFELASSVMERLPQRCFGSNDYPYSRRRQFMADNPGFAKYSRSRRD